LESWGIEATLIKQGSNTVILPEASLAGLTQVKSGTLQLGGDPNGTATATGSIASTSGVTIASGATLAFNHTTSVTPTYAISGDGNLLKQGSGTLTLNSDSNATFTGKTIVTGGKLVISYTAPAPQMIGPLAEITVGDTYASTALDLTGGVEVEDQVTNGHRWEEITLAGINTYTGKLNAENAEINVVIQSGGPTRLDVTGDADITNSKVNVVVADNASFSMGNTYNFLSSQGTNGIIGNFSNNTISASQGRMVNYIFAVQPDGNLRLIGAAPREEMKSLSEGYLAGPAALSHAGDFLASHGIAAARAQLARAYGVTDDGQEIPELGLGGSGLQPFLSHSGGRLRYNTGSHVTSQGYNFLAGVVAGFRAPRGEALAGAFFEYGRGNYDTYNAFAAGDVTGDGDVHHRGLGLFARVGLENGLYVDGSIRRGKVDTTYQSDTLSLAGTRMAFSSKADYTGAHVGVGKLWPLPNLSEKLSLDTYGQAFWTRQDGSDVTLSTGLKVTFDRVDSRRLKAGAKLRYDFTPQTAGYAGVAYDHEFDGKAKARLTDFGGELPVPKMTGGTGVVELGFLITPTASTPVSVDFGIQGHAGKREGLTGNLRLNYYF
jgi:autotransporter-associated beta strand protein